MRTEAADVAEPAVEKIAFGLVDVVDVVTDGKGVVLGIGDAGAELVTLDHVSNKDVIVKDVVLQFDGVLLQEGVDLLAGHGGDGNGIAVGTATLHQADCVGAELLVEMATVLGKVLAERFGDDVVLS